MHYKTICLELLQHQYPALHEQLRSSRTILTAVELHATALKRYHETWIDRLAQSKPGRDESSIASQALELAIEDLREDLCSESPQREARQECFLDAAMAFLLRPTPRA